MTPLPVSLTVELRDVLRASCAAAYPLEACGAILGTGDGVTTAWHVTHLEAAPNEHGDDQRRRYLVPPEFQLRAEKLARTRGEDVIGYYHSHPDHPAQPSEYDRSHAWYGYLYIICAVAHGVAGDVNSFTLNQDQGVFLDVPVRLLPGSQDVSG
jgi:proteasome lid subunit RPN8/RPN11